jgi:hypothetical protein
VPFSVTLPFAGISGPNKNWSYLERRQCEKRNEKLLLFGLIYRRLKRWSIGFLRHRMVEAVRWFVDVVDLNNKLAHTISRVARFFLSQTFQVGKNIVNDHKPYQMAINYTKWQ